MSAKKRGTAEDEKPDLGVKPGDHLLYVPGPDHWHEADAAGGLLFLFEHAADGPPAPVQGGHGRVRKGDPAEGVTPARVERVERTGDGLTLHLFSGHAIRPVGPRRPWRGVVREEDVREPREVEVSHPDSVHGAEKVVVQVAVGRRLVLDVRHPGGVVTLHLPLEGEGAVPHDEGGGPHTWHRPKE